MIDDAQLRREILRVSEFLFGKIDGEPVYHPNAHQWDLWKGANYHTHRPILRQRGRNANSKGWSQFCQSLGFRTPTRSEIQKREESYQEPTNGVDDAVFTLEGYGTARAIREWNHHTHCYEIVGYQKSVVLR